MSSELKSGPDESVADIVDDGELEGEGNVRPSESVWKLVRAQLEISGLLYGRMEGCWGYFEAYR